MFQRASTSLVQTEVNALLPVIYETELTEFKKVKVCIAGPSYANLIILFCLNVASFYQKQVGVGLQLTKYYEVLIQTVPQLLCSAGVI